MRTQLYLDAQAIIAAEYPSELTLDTVAARVATSRRQLQRAFDEIGQTTFRTHLTAVRMTNAQRLLQDTNKTVRVISELVGYRQPAQFAKAYRRVFGHAPSENRTADERGLTLTERWREASERRLETIAGPAHPI